MSESEAAAFLSHLEAFILQVIHGRLDGKPISEHCPEFKDFLTVKEGR